MNQQSTQLLTQEQKYQQKLNTVRIALNHGVQFAVIKSGIPTRTVSRWKLAFTLYGMDGLRTKSFAPKTSPNQKDKTGVLAKALREIVTAEPGLLPVQVLAKLLLVDSTDVPTMSWFKRTKKKLGLNKKRRKREKQHTTRYEIYEPGFLQIDSKSIKKDGETGEKLVQFTAIDECSRVRFLGGSYTKGARAAEKFLEHALAFYKSLGVTVVRVQTDNGTEFTLPGNERTQASYVRGDTEEALFTKACMRHGIVHRLIKPGTPELNGKVERSHRTDEERFYSRFRFDSAFKLDHALKRVWMPEYNEQRPHSSLGGHTPMEFLQRRLKEIAEKQNQDPHQDTEMLNAA